MKKVFVMIVSLVSIAVMIHASGIGEADGMKKNGTKTDEAAAMMQQAKKNDDASAMMKADDTMADTEPMMAASGGKRNFTTLADARAFAERGPVVLFFDASWCPTCRASLKDITEDEKALGNTTVLIVDYDTEKDLEAKYGITYQHTFVQIDAKGNAIARWSGGGVREIIANVKKKGAM
jgi:thiol-disulfide isomerase/thioredoxin